MKTTFLILLTLFLIPGFSAIAANVNHDRINDSKTINQTQPCLPTDDPSCSS